ncbi:MAG TPA: hypothetical protein PK860_01290 [Paludibacteraceae bacterium]|nr:hypothetical protein [Paludibacteraceae bacterium]HOL00160.1 hypothetical protein [Paludibacteraceae bacterium]HPO67747.1 hypothetical protein [Paludibacteraceae bacterium]
MNSNFKKIIYLLISIGIIITLIYFIYKSCFERTPASIVKKVFDVEVKKKNKLNVFKEQWDYNGNGYCLIIFNNVDSDDITMKYKVEKLPLRIELPPTEITSILSNIQRGEYWVKFDSNDSRNLYLFVYDKIKRRAIFYYQLF